MKNNILNKYLKKWSSWGDDLGRGKSINSKSRLRRGLKKKANNKLKKDFYHKNIQPC